MARMVLLEHTLADGGCHWDWLMERPLGGEGSLLISFRVERRIDGVLGDERSFDAVRTPDHRRVYLEFEGLLSGGRGRVVRVASGVVASVEERQGPRGEEMEVRGRFEGEVEERVWLGLRIDSSARDGAGHDEEGTDAEGPFAEALEVWRFESA